jgi:predicted kinase
MLFQHRMSAFRFGCRIVLQIRRRAGCSSRALVQDPEFNLASAAVTASEFPPVPRQRPLAVLLMGLPGAGKSSVAAVLAAQFGLQRVCRDSIRQAMFPDAGGSFAEKRAAFRSVLLALEIHCAMGRSCVLDGMTLARERDRRRVLAVLQRYQSLVLPVFLECPVEVARERVARDLVLGDHPAADREPDLVDRVASRFDPLEPGVLRIDATADAGTVAARVADLVRERMLQPGALPRT